MTREILVLGAGGFIGTHLVRRLRTEGSRIHLKHPEFSTSAADRCTPLLQEWPTGRRRSKPAANRQEFDESIDEWIRPWLPEVESGTPGTRPVFGSIIWMEDG